MSKLYDKLKHVAHRSVRDGSFALLLPKPEVLDLTLLDQLFTAPATSSIGTSGSTRCVIERSMVSVLSRLSDASEPP